MRSFITSSIRPKASHWAALALALCSLPMQALAANVVTKTENIGTVTVPSTVSYGNTFSVPSAIPGFDASVDTFFDDYVFSVGSSSFSNLSATIDLGQVFSISNLQVRLYSGTATTGPAGPALLQGWTSPVGSGGSVVIIDPVLLGAGNYILEVRGNVTGAAGGSYVGSMNFASAAAVPDADGLALAAAGLSSLLWMRARKRKQQ